MVFVISPFNLPPSHQAIAEIDHNRTSSFFAAEFPDFSYPLWNGLFHVEVRCDVIVDQQYFCVGLLKFTIFDLCSRTCLTNEVWYTMLYTLSRCAPLTKFVLKNVACNAILALCVLDLLTRKRLWKRDLSIEHCKWLSDLEESDILLHKRWEYVSYVHLCR